MNLANQIARWDKFWRDVASVEDVEWQLKNLRWLEEFAFHAGTAVDIEHYRALELQIAAGEKKLAELRGDSGVEAAS